MRDVTVIGAGAVGAACALELARRGAGVTVLDRDGAGLGCSYGNAGWLTPSLARPLAAPGMVRTALSWMLDPDSPFHVRLRPDPALAAWLARFLVSTGRARYERNAGAMIEFCRHAVDAWETLAADAAFGFERAGLLALHETEAGLAHGRREADLAARHGIAHEVWSADEVRDREPSIRGPQVGAVFYPGDAHCEPAAATAALIRSARSAGATFEENVEVQGADRTGDRITALRTTRGSRPVTEVVLAAGSMSGILGRRLGASIPMLGGKGYSLLLPRLDPHPRRSIYLATRKVAINPHADALRVSGTLELVPGDDLAVSRRRVDAIVRAARGMLPIPDPPEVHDLWSGLRPCTPDGMPWIGRSRSVSNLWLAVGHQLTGLKTAPATGVLLAELMAGGPTTFDPAPFRGAAVARD